ncbi:MAG TPA: hypothetical protein VLS96_04970 [Nodosilinea sp.]|nr:hypothetical protein [Nodosilinea sp.]
MHPSVTCSLMTRLACATSLGLLITAAPGISLLLNAYAGAGLRATVRTEDDRGSGRLSRLPATLQLQSFRGSGRVSPQPPAPSSSWQPEAVAYRGSGRITEPHGA